MSIKKTNKKQNKEVYFGFPECELSLKNDSGLAVFKTEEEMLEDIRNNEDESLDGMTIYKIVPIGRLQLRCKIIKNA